MASNMTGTSLDFELPVQPRPSLFGTSWLGALQLAARRTNQDGGDPTRHEISKSAGHWREGGHAGMGEGLREGPLKPVFIPLQC
jgi:hypothetical protein